MKPLSRLATSPLYVRCTDVDALYAELARLPSGTHLVVTLGHGLCSLEERFELAEAFARLSESHPLVMKTARGSIAQNMAELAELLRQFPGIRVDLDFGECYLGSEMVLGEWNSFARIVKELSGNIVSLEPPTGGAERLAPESGMVPFVLRLMMRFRFYRVYCILKTAKSNLA